MIDRRGAGFRLASRSQRRSAGIDMNDGNAAGLRAAEPRAGIAEIRPREFAQADDVGPELVRRREIIGLDRDMKQPVHGGEWQRLVLSGLDGLGGSGHGVSPVQSISAAI